MLSSSQQANSKYNDPILQWVTFKLQDEIYGVSVMQVQEVLRFSNISIVPGSPEYVTGIINLRGRVVTVIDTRIKFGLSPSDVSENTRIVIIECGSIVIGILVDSVAEVVYLRESEIDKTPNVGNEETNRYIQGVCHKNDRLLILVDLTRFLSEEELKEIDMI